MSYAPSGPYKSRLFNFLHQQSYKLRERSERNVRHVQVAAVWGVQILLYPIYLLVQSARFAGHQLQQVASQGRSQLDSSAPSDSPIIQVLNAVNILPIAAADVAEDEQTQEQGGRIYSIPHTPTVQGVASQLATRTLVLVTAENGILDILTPEQQHKLASRMSWEVADYWRHRRLTQCRQPFSKRVHSTVNDRRVLPVVRIFWQAMAWIQRGPVAIATNLFQESALVKTQQSTVYSPELEAIPIFAPLAFLVEQLTRFDSTVAELEDKGWLLPASELTSRSQVLLQRLQRSFDKASWQSSTSTEFSDGSETQQRRVHSLIQAAVNYFFGDRRSKLPLTDSSKQPALAGNSTDKLQLGGDRVLFHPKSSLGVGRQGGSLQLVNEGKREHGIWKVPGLVQIKKAVSKLIQSGNSAEIPETTHPSQANAIQSLIRAAINYFFGSRGRRLHSTGFSEQATLFSPYPGESHQLPGRHTSLLFNQCPDVDPWLTIGDLFGEQTAPTSDVAAPTNKPANTLLGGSGAAISYSIESQTLSNRSPGQISLQNLKLPSNKLTGRQTETAVTKKAKRVNASLDHAPDWIETQSTPVGYVKHPLEIVLGWLDRGMLWLEEILVKVWRWVRHLK